MSALCPNISDQILLVCVTEFRLNCVFLRNHAEAIAAIDLSGKAHMLNA